MDHGTVASFCHTRNNPVTFLQADTSPGFSFSNRSQYGTTVSMAKRTLVALRSTKPGFTEPIFDDGHTVPLSPMPYALECVAVVA